MIEENIINEEPAQNEVVDVDELERLIDFYAYDNDILEEEYDDDEDE